ncbi:MAG: putative metal-dependent hydrolase, partial [Saprospiraceae bacterium]|nr:putative metal-dependent hydrolase [Saprospiraceae bacterium]
MKEQDNRRYPIGPFEYGRTYSIEDTRKQIKALERFPKELKKMVKKLRGGDLDKPYRTDGWTVRQVIHHIADSHINAYIRIKLAVTENTPIIKPYEEQLWAETEDGKNAPIRMSIKMISALHTRWVAFMESLSEEDLKRGYYHPDAKRTVLVQEAIALYVWHSQHHLHHIQLIADGKSKGQDAAMPSPDAMIVLDDSHTPKRRGPKPKAKPELAATTAGPKKRGMSEEHKAKIRAAHEARRIAKGREAKPTPPPPAEGKRTRRTKEQMAADRAALPAVTERKKPGPKPKAAASAESTSAASAATKRIRRTKEQMTADRATAAVAQPTERRKPGRPAQPKAAKPAGTEPQKRGMSAEHMAKIREARMAKRAAAIAAGEIIPKPEKAAASADGAPKKRGMSAEHMAKIREARMAKRAAAITAGQITPKPQKAAASAHAAPKKLRMRAEHR